MKHSGFEPPKPNNDIKSKSECGAKNIKWERMKIKTLENPTATQNSSFCQIHTEHGIYSS